MAEEFGATTPVRVGIFRESGTNFPSAPPLSLEAQLKRFTVGTD